MKEKPIIFSTPMVRAILDGRKTMTRRVIKLPGEPDSVGWGCPVKIDHNGTEYPGEKCYAVWGEDWHVKCKYAPGDLLWVRETWRPTSDIEGGYQLKADVIERDDWSAGKWKPSIFMPKHLARLWLEVTDVRVERLQEITEEDAEREGVEAIDPLDLKTVPMSVLDSGRGTVLRRSFKAAFYELWDTLNAKRGYGWDFNPWVYVISFRRVRP